MRSFAALRMTKRGEEMIPSKENITICFAHAAYRMKDRFELRKTGIQNFQAWAYRGPVKRIGEADVVVASGMWKNDLIPHAGKLKFIRSIGSGMDEYSRERLGAKNIRLASAAGVNARAVAEHALALILAVARRLPEARDNQHKKMWRGMLGDLTQREDELGGKTLLIVGMGRIGSHLARLAKAFGMRVIATKRDAPAGEGLADAVFPPDRLMEQLAEADVVVLTCPLTAHTEGLIDARAFAAMKPSAFLINVARGRVVQEAALIAALAEKRIAGAGIDCTQEEPLQAASPLWALDNEIIT